MIACFYIRWVRVPRLRSGASARVARERGGCAINSFEVHGLVDVGSSRLAPSDEVAGAAGRARVVAVVALRKKTRSGAVGRRTRGKRRGRCCWEVPPHLAANRAYKMSEDRCECVFHAAYATRNRAIVFQQNLDNRKNSPRAALRSRAYVKNWFTG